MPPPRTAEALTLKQNPPSRHHYLPVFYTKRWATRLSGGRICEFSKPYNTIKPKSVRPEGTGYVDGLYTLADARPDQRQRIESDFMSPMDAWAADALAMLEAGALRADWTSHTRSAWTRYILSLLLRMPEDILFLKASYGESEWALTTEDDEREYQLRRRPGWPDTIVDFMRWQGRLSIEAQAVQLAPTLIDHEKIGSTINEMAWTAFDLSHGGIELLTSDRPVLMSETLIEDYAYIILPIGPSLVFVAGKDPGTLQRFGAREAGETARVLNMLVCNRAKKFVYGSDDAQLEFVREHFGTRPHPSILERLAEFRARRRAEAG